MASARNDAMLERTVEGSLNYYDKHRGCGTATDKGLAARMGGHSYNIINNDNRHEIYFKDMRHDDHFIDKKGRHTRDFVGARRRKFAGDERQLMTGCLSAPAPHPREDAQSNRRVEIQVAQIENSNSYAGYQERCKASFFPPPPPKRYSIDNRKYCNEAGKLYPQHASKANWMARRGEVNSHSISCPNLSHSAPHESLAKAVRQDARKEATQRQTESAHFAPWMAGNTHSCSMDATELGRRLGAEQRFCSVNRLENEDFAVARKNNHYSSHDKLTRADPFFMRPRLSMTNSSVKYDMISNQRKWFKYS